MTFETFPEHRLPAARTRPGESRDRLVATAAATVLHLCLGYALLTGFGFRASPNPDRALKLFKVERTEPAPPIEKGAPEEPEAGGGASSFAPASPIPDLPSPLVVTQLPVPDAAPIAQASLGSGPEAGGTGNGSGTGQDDGVGDGIGNGGGTKAQRTHGALRDGDYPLAARQAGAEGIVFVRFTIAPSGRVSDCMVTRSSGNADLDGTTCRLIVKRFRYRPAKDGQGKPVPETVALSYEWGLYR